MITEIVRDREVIPFRNYAKFFASSQTLKGEPFKMKRLVMTIALTCLLSVSAFAGQIPTVGDAPPVPGQIPTVGSPSPAPGDSPSVDVMIILTIINLVR